MFSKITAFGAYAPERIVTNQDMEKIVDTSDEWIQKRTGIIERHYAAKGQTTVDLATEAVKDLQKRSGKDLNDVDLILVATSTTEHVIPSIASQIQNNFGIKHAGCIDQSAACAGFIYSLTIADSMIRTGNYKKVLVVGVEILTKHTNFEDRTTCILFGDGAGACLVESSETQGFYKPVSGAEGDKGYLLYISKSGKIINGEEVMAHDMIVQDGQKVFKWAVSTMSREFKALLKKNNMTNEDIDYFIPHSANKRIIEAICNFTDYPLERTLSSIEKYGNTSAASIPLAIMEALNEDRIKNGSRMLLIGFGGGLTYAGTIVEWNL